MKSPYSMGTHLNNLPSKMMCAHT